MDKKKFEKDAVKVGKLMEQYSSFGFITDGAGNYRLFSGGNANDVLWGCAMGLAHLCEDLGTTDVITDVAGLAMKIVEERKSEVSQ